MTLVTIKDNTTIGELIVVYSSQKHVGSGGGGGGGLLFTSPA